MNRPGNRGAGLPAMDRQYRIWLIETTAPDRFSRRLYRSSVGTMRRLVAMWAISDVPTPAACLPPGKPISRAPAPAKVVVVVPPSAHIGQVSPLFARHPDVSELRCPHPVAAPIRIPVSRCCFERRPDVALAGNVIPVSVGVEIAPGRIVAVGCTAAGRGFSSLLGVQFLVAVGVPRIPGVRLNGFRQIVDVGIGGIQRNTLPTVQVERKGIATLQMSVAGKDGDFAGKIVEADAHHGKATTRDRAITEAGDCPATANRRSVGTGIATVSEEGSGILSGDAVERGSECVL